jgi:hypothetical protein
LKWTIVKTNILPEAVVVSGGTLYLQAGRELAIISLNSVFQGFRTLPEGLLVSIDACAVEYKSGEFEPGISVVFFMENSGYKVRQYSCQRSEP